MSDETISNMSWNDDGTIDATVTVNSVDHPCTIAEDDPDPVGRARWDAVMEAQPAGQPPQGSPLLTVTITLTVA